jgi:protocatechuate 3,4-dioxygenase beta subunit
VIVDAAGKPIEGVEVDVWQSSPIGLYENQVETQADMNLRGKFTTDERGHFGFWSAAFTVDMTAVFRRSMESARPGTP